MDTIYWKRATRIDGPRKEGDLVMEPPGIDELYLEEEVILMIMVSCHILSVEQIYLLRSTSCIFFSLSPQHPGLIQRVTRGEIHSSKEAAVELLILLLTTEYVLSSTSLVPLSPLL